MAKKLPNKSRRIGSKPKSSGGERGGKRAGSGRPTRFPGKSENARSWRLQQAQFDALDEAGARITDEDGKPVGATEVLEALIKLHAPSITYAQIVRASKM